MTILALLIAAAAVDADSTRGARLFQTLACVECHGVGNEADGRKLGPNLVRMIDRNFTPAALAAMRLTR